MESALHPMNASLVQTSAPCSAFFHLHPIPLRAILPSRIVRLLRVADRRPEAAIVLPTVVVPEEVASARQAVSCVPISPIFPAFSVWAPAPPVAARRMQIVLQVISVSMARVSLCLRHLQAAPVIQNVPTI